jgi:lipopolysaccharide export LptBFGC system permease protein LptF
MATQKKQEDQKSGFELLMEVVGFLLIIASPLLMGLIAAAFIYLSNPSESRLMLSIFVAVTGLVVGLIFAWRVRRKGGTMHFMSRTDASPEFDELNKKKD